MKYLLVIIYLSCVNPSNFDQRCFDSTESHLFSTKQEALDYLSKREGQWKDFKEVDLYEFEKVHRYQILRKPELYDLKPIEMKDLVITK